MQMTRRGGICRWHAPVLSATTSYFQLQRAASQADKEQTGSHTATYMHVSTHANYMQTHAYPCIPTCSREPHLCAHYMQPHAYPLHAYPCSREPHLCAHYMQPHAYPLHAYPCSREPHLCAHSHSPWYHMTPLSRSGSIGWIIPSHRGPLAWIEGISSAHMCMCSSSSPSSAELSGSATSGG